jgi:TetR/AcrR family transcriptional repressor of mexJK operon
MRQWSADNPKASLMERKRALIVAAAQQAFLDKGYAESSMGRIAEAAGVSIKTVYRHFENKDDLFSAVMHAACNTNGMSDTGEEAPQHLERPWFSKEPRQALPLAGIDYLTDVLGAQQLALYRVVTRDAHRFPELGQRYRAEVTDRRTALFADYLRHWAPLEQWKIKDIEEASRTFLALLRVDLLDNALFGTHQPNDEEISRRAHSAADNMLHLLQASRF